MFPDRIFSGMRPTGSLHLGHYHGVLKNWVRLQSEYPCFFCVVDWHALTTHYETPEVIEKNVWEVLIDWLASGIDPAQATLFIQSKVPEHAELALLLGMSTPLGWLERVPTYKEQMEKLKDRDLSTYGFLGYPVLMAADILAYGTDEVPVGDDQTQHVELTRDLAVRFNQRYGHTFVVPRATRPAVAARVMNLQEPTSKMGKSDDSGPGIVYLLDEPDVVRKKVMRAVTDSAAEVVYDREARPGVANLLEILAACGGGNPEDLSGVYESYGTLKKDTAEAVVELLRPVQERHKELCADPAYVEGVLRDGAEKAREMAKPMVDTAYRAIGLLPA